MIPAITDIRRSLSDCRSSFDRLADIRPVNGESVVRNTMFAEFAVEWRGGRWLLCTPLAEDAVERVARMATQLKRVAPKYIAEYRVFHSELRFTDSAGGVHMCDVVMQRMPDGVSLEHAASVLSHERMLGELDAMQAEFRRLGFTHNNLKPCNVIVTDDERLVAVRCHFARFGDDTQSDDAAFGALRRLVMSKPLAEDSEYEPECRSAESLHTEAGVEIAGAEHERMVLIRRDGLYGYADPHGVTVIEPQFDAAENFREGRAEVEVNGRMGLIDKSGRWVIPPRYDYLEYRDDSGISIVRSGDVWSAFDYEGHPTGIRHEDAGRVRAMLAERMNIKIEI